MVPQPQNNQLNLSFVPGERNQEHMQLVRKREQEIFFILFVVIVLSIMHVDVVKFPIRQSWETTRSTTEGQEVDMSVQKGSHQCNGCAKWGSLRLLILNNVQDVILFVIVHRVAKKKLASTLSFVQDHTGTYTKKKTSSRDQSIVVMRVCLLII